MLALKFTSPQSEHEQAIERSITVFCWYEYNRIFARTKHSYLYNKRLYMTKWKCSHKVISSHPQAWFVALDYSAKKVVITRPSNIIDTTYI